MDKHFYVEFSDNEYYALIAVTREDNDLYFRPHIEATKLYVSVVDGESVEQVVEEAYPHIRTKEYAFEKFIRANGHDDLTIIDAIKQFDETDHGVLLIDRSLL